jgi:nucleoside-diphosphate-sugar epimerase
MNKAVSISVVGCGWLGLPLAESLIARGFRVKGTTTTSHKLEILANKGIDPYLVHFTRENLSIDAEILDSDLLIINIPPGGRDPQKSGNYQLMADYFATRLPDSPVRKIILVSSTSVYQENNTEIFEADLAEPDSETGKLLEDTENKFLAIQNKKICVVRAAGLVGPERHPGKFFRSKSNVPNGLAPVNLIHRDDVIGIIHKLIESEDASGIYNACSPSHPSKKNFYQVAARNAGFPPPDFIPEKLSWKIISSSRVYDDLGYVFKYPDLIKWLELDSQGVL